MTNGRTRKVVVAAVAALPLFVLVSAAFGGSSASAGGRSLHQTAPTPTFSPIFAQASPSHLPRGPQLFLQSCAWCHGTHGEGTDRGPSLIGVGAADADFYLSTGRMPIAQPQDNPGRKQPAYPPAQIRLLANYIAKLAPGPPIPSPGIRTGNFVLGETLYLNNCAACHSSAGVGGALTNGQQAPPLGAATPVQVAESIRVGPGTMPVFGPDVFDDHDVNSIVRYVAYLQHPDDRGGIPFGHLGPIAEGAAAWLVGLLAILLVTRWIGESGKDTG